MKWIVIIVCSMHASFALSQSDSLRLLSDTQAALSASYSMQDHWMNETFQYVMINGSCQRRSYWEGNGSNRIAQLNYDLAYTHIMDSIWTKNTDRMIWTRQWNQHLRWFEQSMGFTIQTSLLPEYTMHYNEQERREVAQRTANSFGPTQIDVQFGLSHTFWNGSSIQAGLATFRLEGAPNDRFEKDVLFQTSFFEYRLHYGFSLNAMVQKRVTPFLEWNMHARLFGNGTAADDVRFEWNNRLQVEIWKGIQLKLETRLQYDPLINYYLQWSQQIMLGWCIQKRRDRNVKDAVPSWISERE